MSLYHQRINSLWMSIFLSGALSACSASNENRILTVDLGIPVRSPGVSSKIDPRLEKLFGINIGTECYQDQIFLLSRNKTTGATIELKKLPIKSVIPNTPNINYDNTSGDIDNVISFLKNQTTLESTPTIAAPRTEKIEVGIIGQFAKPQDTNRDGICDPESNSLNNSWIKSTDLITNVYSHTANLLPNGKIMVIGGISSSAAVNTVQLFDPSTRQWTSTTPSNAELAPRYDHTATALRDGRVVVIGGKNSLSVPASAIAASSSISIYTPGPNDETAGTWSTRTPPAGFTANLYGHTATLLPDQRILIIGGTTGGSSSNSSSQAGIYNPNDNSWQALSSLTEGRESHVTIVKNGKIVVVGGKKLVAGSTYPSEKILIAEAGSSWSSYPQSSTFKRIGMSAVDLNEKSILIVGGAEESGNIVNSVHQFDTETGEITNHSTLQSTSADHVTIKLPGGYILNVGGSLDNTNANLATQIFEPNASGTSYSWQTKTQLNQARKKFAAVALPNGNVMMIGGCTGAVTGGTCTHLNTTTVETFVPFNAASYTTSVIGHTSVDTNSMVGDTVMINLQVLHSNPNGDYNGAGGAPNLSDFQGKKDWMSIPTTFSPTSCQFGTAGSYTNCPSSTTAHVTEVRYFKNDNDLLVKTGLKTSTGSNAPNYSQYYLPHAKQMEVFFDLYNYSLCNSNGNPNNFCGRYKAYLDENYSGTVTATLVQGYYTPATNTLVAIQGTFTRTTP